MKENIKLMLVTYPKVTSILLLLGIYTFINCNKREDRPTCPVEYEVTAGENFPLAGKWKFIGFEDQARNTIEYQPCGGNKVFIVLSDSTHNRPADEHFKYPYIFQGRTLINSYRGSYQQDDKQQITFSETIKSKLNGTEEIEEFQDRYHQALRDADHYKIQNNLLSIHYGDSKHLLFVAQQDTVLF